MSILACKFGIAGDQSCDRVSKGNFKGERSCTNGKLANFDALYQKDLAAKLSFLLENILAAVDHSLPAYRGLDAGWRSIKQLHAERLLEPGNAARQGGL